MRMTCISHPFQPRCSGYGETASELQGARELEGLGVRPLSFTFWSLKIPLGCDGAARRARPFHLSSLPEGSVACEGMWTISHLCRGTEEWPRLLDSLHGPGLQGARPLGAHPSCPVFSLPQLRETVFTYFLSSLLPLPFSFLSS